MPVYRLVMAYDGSGFRGFARQPGIRTVQGELESALERVLDRNVPTTGAGRTDAGVHARGQVVSFTLSEEADLERLKRSLTGLLSPEISVIGLYPAPTDFDARFSASWRRYRYQILNREANDPLQRATVWHVPELLDEEAMSREAEALLGEHDFAAFCRRVEGASMVRRVDEASWSRQGDLLRFDIKASAFCHQMVRSLVGFLVEVGKGKRPPGDVGRVLAGRDRSRAGQLAPPHGLILWEVGYDD